MPAVESITREEEERNAERLEEMGETIRSAYAPQNTGLRDSTAGGLGAVAEEEMEEKAEGEGREEKGEEGEEGEGREAGEGEEERERTCLDSSLLTAAHAVTFVCSLSCACLCRTVRIAAHASMLVTVATLALHRSHGCTMASALLVIDACIIGQRLRR